MFFVQSPFNYTGSKYPQLDELYSYFPKDCDTIVDLFVGGGSVSINSNFSNVIINDIITDLIDFYYQLRNKQLGYIIQQIQKYKVNSDDQQAFLKLRQSYNKNKNCYKFFNLCSSCTNNMMRFNKKMEFNQTFGKRTVNENTINKLMQYWHKIQKIQSFKCFNKNFYEVPIPKNSFVYLDPPYLITQAGYNHYWNVQLEIKLYDYLLDLNQQGVKFGLSNMLYHKGSQNVYLKNKLKNFNFHIIDSFKNKAKKKMSVEQSVQVFVTNY